MTPIHFNIIIREDETSWLAECIDNSVAAYGETIEEALYNLKGALELYYEEECCHIEIEYFSVETVGGVKYRPGIVRPRDVSVASERSSSAIRRRYRNTLIPRPILNKEDLHIAMRACGLDIHVSLLSIPVLGHIYALILLTIALFMCYAVIHFLWKGEFFISVSIAFVLVISILCIRAVGSGK